MMEGRIATLLLPVQPEVRIVEESRNYGKFVVAPLERGFGTTLGNALRRVLLSSIPGYTVTRVMIDGVLHEFSTIPGVVEDVLEILLNIKQLAIKVHEGSVTPEGGEWVLRLDVEGEGEVTGADIVCPPGVEIVNPEAHIATLTDPNAKLRMEMVVERGKGFVPAEKQEKARGVIGVIPMDAVFSPVRKVNFHVEPMRVGMEIGYERLTMEIWTNGAIKPDEALSEAARILSSHLEILLDFKGKAETERLTAEEMERRRREFLKVRVDDERVGFSVRTVNCLMSAGIETIEQLVERTPKELLKIRNFGRKSLQEVQRKLEEYGLSLKEEG